MNTFIRAHRPSNTIIHLLIALVVLFTLAMPALPAAQARASQPPDAALPQQLAALQFLSDNHITSFEPTQVRLIGVNHMLEVEFLATQGIQPASAAQKSTAGLTTLQQVTYPNLWQGVTVVYSISPGGIAKSEYQLAPRTNPASIRLRYNVPPVLQADGSLVFAFDQADGMMIESAPIAWQVKNGENIPVEVAFRITDKNEVGFALGRYDPALPLVIDPAYRWHAFYGGKPVVELVGSCQAGMIYVIGTVNADINQDWNYLDMFYHGGKDIVVSKIDAGGYWVSATYFGSDGDDEAQSVACDSTNKTFYIVGTSAKTWNGAANTAPIHSHSGNSDIAVISLSADAADNWDLLYNWHTFFGSASIDQGQDIALNGASLYVAGTSFDTWKANPAVDPKHAYQGDSDLVAIHLTAAGGAYTWHTFYGGVQGTDSASGIASQGSDVWLVGTSNATWKGGSSTNINPLHAHSGGNDAAILKLDNSGNYSWHTFYGSASNDVATAVVLNSSTAAGYIVGYGAATWNGDGTGTNTPKHAYTGGSDIFVLNLTSAGAYQWHTFYGSSSSDEGRDIERDTSNNLYVVGYSAATWNAPTAPVIPFGGAGDGFFLALDSSGNYVRHEFYGGSALDALHGINMNGNMPLLIGFSDATWNGPAGQAPKEAHTGAGSRNGLRIWHTVGAYSSHAFLNSDYDDTARAVTVDQDGNIIVVGETSMSWLGPGNIAPLKKFNGGNSDLLVLKLNSTGGYLWHTIYGGLRTDLPADVVTDSSGSIYVTGYSNEPWLGPTSQAPLRAYSASNDIYVLKLNSSGAYLWHTFLGGNSNDEPSGIFYTASPASLFIVGKSTASWTGLTPKHAITGGQDAVIASLNPSTGAFQWYTYYGASVNDGAVDAFESGGFLYVAGFSQATWNGPSGQSPLRGYDGSEYNTFIMKLDDAGNYNWHTFYGIRSVAVSITVDAAGSIYVLASNKTAWNGPAGQLPTHTGGEYAAYLMKLTSAGTYVWHGFFGGNNACMVRGMDYSATTGLFSIICEAAQEWTDTNIRPPFNPFQTGRDVVLLQVTDQGQYKGHTYLGWSGTDYAGGVANQPSTGLVIVAGHSQGSWNYLGKTPSPAFNGGSDIFVAAFAPLNRSFRLPLILK